MIRCPIKQLMQIDDSVPFSRAAGKKTGAPKGARIPFNPFEEA
jgi:hypothetical protein